MNRSEPKAKHAAQREAIIATLSAAGWDTSGLELGGPGGRARRAVAEYRGRIFDLQLGPIGGNGVSFELDDRDGDLSVSTRLYAGHRLDQVLQFIVAHQDGIDRENYGAVVKSLVPLCESVLLERGDGLVRLA